MANIECKRRLRVLLIEDHAEQRLYATEHQYDREERASRVYARRAANCRQRLSGMSRHRMTTLFRPHAIVIPSPDPVHNPMVRAEKIEPTRDAKPRCPIKKQMVARRLCGFPHHNRALGCGVPGAERCDLDRDGQVLRAEVAVGDLIAQQEVGCGQN